MRIQINLIFTILQAYFFEVYPFRIEHQYLYYIYIQINNARFFYEKQKMHLIKAGAFAFFLYLVF